MRLVAFGTLVAMVFGAGCALQAGDPGEPTGTSTVLTASGGTPKVFQAMTPAGAGSATPPNPEPSPWFPTGPQMDEDSTGSNPEPSPWHPDTPTEGAGTAGDPQGGAAGPTTGSAGGSTPNHPGHLGAL